MTITAQSEVGALRRLLLKRPGAAWQDPDRVDRQWRSLGYLGRPDLGRATAEHDHLLDLLARAGARVDLLPADGTTGLDSIYVRDAALATDAGLVLCRMGKAARRGEPAALGRAAAALGIPVRGEIEGDGTLEGGDTLWLGPRTLAVGLGYRTNREGIRQLGELLGPEVELVVVPLPHWRGPGDVFHLMSMISPLARDLALVYSPLLPVPFRELLLERGIALVEVPDAELDSLGANVLALAPRRCLAVAGNPLTRRRLEAAGVEVVELPGEEICRRGSGGPTCLTRPLLRAD